MDERSRMIAITIRWRIEGVDFMEDVCNLCTTVCNELADGGYKEIEQRTI